MSFDVFAKLILKISLLSILISFSVNASAASNEESTIIWGDRIKSSIYKSTNDVRIFNSEDISKTYSLTLPELLSKESDLNIVSSGPNGQSASLFTRGTDSSHTLVVIDGVIMNDPSNPNRQFDIGKLSLNNIERIEILKGSQGLAYGSNAIGGVIVITTKKAKSKQLTGESYLNYGTFQTTNLGSNFQKKITDNLGLSFGADYMGTKGFSAADLKYNPKAEKDGAQRVTLDLGTEAVLSENYTVNAFIRYAHNLTDLDKNGGAGNDDINDRQKEEEIYSKVQLTKDWNGGMAETKFGYNFSKHYRLLEVRPDAIHPQSSNSTSVGEIHSVDINHTYYISEKLTQNINLEFQTENDQSQHDNQNLSAFLYHQYELVSNIFNFGLRLDHNQVFKNHLTYKLAVAHKFQDSLLKLSYATGFKSPSLNQLFDPTYGSQNLQPETSQSTDLSFEKKWTDKISTVSTVFYTKINERLSFRPITFINTNFGKAEILGLEKKIIINWAANINQTLSATILKTKDLDTGLKLKRRPDLNIKNVFDFLFGNNHSGALEFSYTGLRDDFDTFGNTVKMPSYFLTNLNYRYIQNTHNEFHIKLNNVFNLEYEDIYGYGTAGRSILIGAQYNY